MKESVYREQLYEVEWVDNHSFISIAANRAPENFEVSASDVVGDPIFLKPIRVRGGIWSSYGAPMVKVDIIEDGTALEIKSREIKYRDKVIGTSVYVSYPKLPVVVDVYSKGEEKRRRVLILANGLPENPIYQFPEG